MSETFRGVSVPVAVPLGREVRRWRVLGTTKRIRLLDRDGQWGVLLQDEATEMRVYPTRETAEQVCRQLIDTSGLEWDEIDPQATHWWG